MYFFYIDESGSRDPQVVGERKDGTDYHKDHVYSLTAVGIFERRWKTFHRYITFLKRQHISRIERKTGKRLELSECEIKSNWIRIPSERAKHPFLSQLDNDELAEIAETYFRQIEHHHMRLFSVVIDKRELHDYIDSRKLHKKAWELLCERIENYMAEYHPKHNALLICDDMTRQENLSLAMKHAYLLEAQTTAGLRLRHILELPFFVRSELSEGIQLADLCSYSVYRAFRDEDLEYPYFKAISESFYCSGNTGSGKTDGLKIFPESSALCKLLDTGQKE